MPKTQEEYKLVVNIEWHFKDAETLKKAHRAITKETSNWWKYAIWNNGLEPKTKQIGIINGQEFIAFLTKSQVNILKSK